VYSPTYFDHDAFMHHPMHVLDAPEYDINSLAYFFIEPLCTSTEIHSKLHIQLIDLGLLYNFRKYIPHNINSFYV